MKFELSLLTGVLIITGMGVLFVLGLVIELIVRERTHMNMLGDKIGLGIEVDADTMESFASIMAKLPNAERTRMSIQETRKMEIQDYKEAERDAAGGYATACAIDRIINNALANRPISENADFWRIVTRTVGTSLNIINERLVQKELP